MVFNLLKEIMNVKLSDKENLEFVKELIEDRAESIEYMEPDSCGETYYRWCDRYDDIQDMLDTISDLVDNYEVNDENEKVLLKLKNQAQNHQYEYGGLKRFR